MRLREALNEIEEKGFIVTSHGAGFSQMDKQAYEAVISLILAHPDKVGDIRVLDDDLLFELDGGYRGKYHIELYKNPVRLRITRGKTLEERIRRSAIFEGPAIRKLRRSLLKRVRGAKA
ncbi:hypothetical protein [Thermococcus sp.]